MAPYDEPNMSDAALLMTVEDLINQAMGSPYKNVINFKLMQTVLHILARQQRLLEQRVEIRITDLSPPRHKFKKERVIQESPESSSSAKSPRPKGRMADIKEEKLDKTLKEKAEKISQKEQEIGRGTSKEREKAEKQSQKEQERAEKLAQKELEKAGKTAKKEQEKSEKQAQKDQEKAEKERLKSEKLAQKEREKAEKTSTKEKEKIEKASLKDKERAKSPKKEKKTSDTGIAISEGKRGKEKVLVVEKGPTTRSDAHARGSIDVVTQSQFALLEAAVRELRDMSAPMTMTMPDNEKLRSDLAKGNATLPDTMQAMQIDARVKAAERAIARMTGLLTQLAAAGGLPEDLEQQMEQMQIGSVLYDAEAQAEALKLRPSARKSVVISPSAKISESTDMRTSRPSVATSPRPGAAATPRPSMSIMKQPSSRTSTATIDAGVTHDELEDSVNRLREELIKSMNNLTTRAAATADNALHTAKSVADKLDIAMSLDVRISTLHSLATDYAEQLNGFDAGLTTQMQSFREQMVQMRSDLKGGLTQLESVNNNAETAAVTELSERYQDLVTELDSTLHAHRSLTNFQSQLASELHSLVECVEMLREQKADKDEVADGLRDKADTSRLAGLLTEAEFAMARADLERRLAVCHDKFQRQDNVWMTAMKDLNNVVDGKSELVGLLSARDELQRELRVLHARLQVLAAVLGEPKAAVVKRQLALGAACAACGAPALMSPRDAAQGAPPRLPALRPPPAGAPSREPCFKDWMPPELPDDSHACQRWCGGSHTRMAGGTRRARAEGAGGAGGAEGVPTRPYTGYGTDGRLYMMEEELQPCVECNELLQKVPDDVPTLDFGAGDHKTQQETVVNIHLAY